MGSHLVPQSGSNRDNKHMRKTIRRHVMLGKNTGKIRAPKQPMRDGYAVFHKDSWIESAQLQQPEVPRRVGSDLSFLRFADTVEPAIISETLQFCATVDEKMFALEPCIDFDSTNGAATCIQSLTHGALHLNTMIFGAQAYMNHVFWQSTSQQRQRPRHAISRHYGQALSLLRDRLTEVGRQPSETYDIVITAITSLAACALVSGDSANARNHVDGLSKVVNMRGLRIYSFMEDPKHLIELLRCDLFVSLATGRSPLFFPDRQYERCFPLAELEAANSTLELSLMIRDSELTKFWNILTHFLPSDQ